MMDRRRLLTVTEAARYAGMDRHKFKLEVEAGRGPRQWAGEMYVHPHFHPDHVDAWLLETRERAA